MRHATRRTLRRARDGALALGLLALAAAAGADPPGVPLAAPGACAEPRAPLGAEQRSDDFEIAGSPRHHFTPGDVALGPPGAGAFTPPEVPTFTRGPCDAPTAGCRTILDRAPIVIDEPPVGTDPPPGGK
jgi:hypothetical protein